MVYKCFVSDVLVFEVTDDPLGDISPGIRDRLADKMWGTWSKHFGHASHSFYQIIVVMKGFYNWC